MAVRVGINGFGRMGRLGLRAAWHCDELEFVHINEISSDAAAQAHLLKFDSIHGRWDHEVSSEDRVLLVDGVRIGYSSCRQPGDIDWRSLGVDLVIESSGKFRTPETLRAYFERGVRKVAVRVPPLNASLTDCVFEVARNTTVDEVNGLLRTTATGPLRGILGYEELPLVSIDYKSDPRSSIIDALSTRVINHTLVKILAWYDHEFGYANRMMELARKIAGSL